MVVPIIKILSSIAFIIALILTTPIKSTSAQTPTISIAPTSETYQIKGTFSILRSGDRYNIQGSISELPATIPNNGQYYILWATIADGRADNLGAISNNAPINSTIVGKPTQIFITAERERFPEFVEGPRLAQSKQLADSDFTILSNPSASPQSTTEPAGQPNDAPETGLGGSLLFYAFSLGLTTIGSIGALRSFKNKR
jgi:hypothetical protein